MKRIQSVRAHLDSDLSTFAAHCGSDDEVSLKTVLARHLSGAVFKKLEITSRSLEDDAFALFSKINRRGFTFGQDSISSWDRSLLDMLALEFEQFLRPLEREDDWMLALARLGYHGSGKSTKVDQTDSYHKYFCSRLTTSNPRLIAPYRVLCSENGWSDQEKDRQRHFGIEVIPGGSLAFVPKDFTKYRSIVTEPSLDMFFQLGLHNYITSLSRRLGITPETQWKHARHLARKGSIDGSYATIDSTSASDTIYLEYLTELGVIPVWFATLIREIKSPLLTYKGKTLKISMMGTMGCGFTFAVMTALLTCAVRVVYKSLDIPLTSGFSVWGDDVIVVTPAYERTMRMLELLGFIPNPTKSFSLGYFRESCGGDFFKGVFVRGIYCKKLKTKHDVYSLFNRLLSWSCRTEIILYDTLRYLFHSAPNNPIPLYEDIESGFRMPVYFARPDTDDNGSFRYIRYQVIPLTLKPRVQFHYAMEKCFIGGYIDRKGRASMRRDGDSRKVRKSSISPCWDYNASWTDEFPVQGDVLDRIYHYILS